MTEMKFSKAGSVSKSYGNAGEVYIKIFSDALMDILDSIAKAAVSKAKAAAPKAITAAPPLYISMDGILTPFFVQSCTPKGNSGFIVKFSTVRDAAHAEELVGKEIMVQKEEGDFSDLQELVGYTVENEDGKRIGKIADVIEYPANICLSIKKEDSSEEVLIPFHPDLVLKFDSQEKRIAMKIAEGLL